MDRQQNIYSLQIHKVYYVGFVADVAFGIAEPTEEYGPHRPRLYLDTTVPSYLVARLSRDITVARRQMITREWWQKHRGGFDIYISEHVIHEAAAGDAHAAGQRLAVLAPFPLLPRNAFAKELSKRILAECKLPARAATDAAHLAMAAVYEVQFLLTWNCTHLANEQIIPTIKRILSADGYVPPIICTPESLVGGRVYERSNS